MKTLKYSIMICLSIFIMVSCGDETTTLKIDDTDPKKEELVSPLPYQNGITVNSAGNLVSSENYKFQFVVGMNRTIKEEENVVTKKYNFTFIGGNNIVQEENKSKYRFTLIR